MGVYDGKTKVAGLGYPGPQGIQGEQGLQGIQGPQGEAGPQGIQGVKGDTGAKGDQGDQGIQGIQGPIGQTGPQGEQGIQGIQGATGETGTQGIQGPIGETGPQGPQGIQGEVGPTGPTGLTGPTGPQGPQGEQGAQGPQGEIGETGPAGLNGTGVPDGGTTGQLLAKESNDNGDFMWINPVDILNVFYPVGTIYQSVNNTNPGTFMGGTWAAWGAGKFIVGVDAGQTEFDTVEETGGAKKINLTEAQLPGHVHTIDHDHGSVTSGNDAGHYHGVAAIATAGAGGHSHNVRWRGYTVTYNSAGTFLLRRTDPADAYQGDDPDAAQWVGDHAHTVPAQNTGGVSAYHSHTVDLPNYTGNSGNGPGSGADINILNPYITCYFWKRTA